MNKKRIAVIGLGGIANSHIHFLQILETATLVAGVDCNPLKRIEFSEKHGLRAYGDIEALLEREELDGIIIATPPSQREAIVEKALQRSLAVLSEKPLADSEESARRIFALSELYPTSQLHVGYCHRFTGAAQEARKILHENGIGEPVWMQIAFSSNTPTMEQHWMTDPLISGGGAAMDNACHALDLFQFLLGPIENSSGLYRYGWKNRGEDSFAINAQTREGALGLFAGSYLCSAPRNTWEICGTKATLRYDYGSANDQLLQISSDASQELIAVSSPGKRFKDQLSAWISSMDGTSNDLATAKEGLEIATRLSAIAIRSLASAQS